MLNKIKIFHYFTTDKNWVVKFVFGAILYALFYSSTIFIAEIPAKIMMPYYGLISFFAYMLVAGYKLENINERLVNPQGGFAPLRFKTLISSFFVALITLGITLIISALCANFNLNLILHLALGATFRPSYILSAFAFGVLFFVIDLLLFAMSISYAKDLKFKSIFNFKRIFHILTDKKLEFAKTICKNIMLFYIPAFIIYLNLTILIDTQTEITIIHSIFMLVTGSIIAFYVDAIIVQVISSFMKKIENKSNEEAVTVETTD